MTTPMPLPEFDYVVDWSGGVPRQSDLAALTELANARETKVLTGVRLPEGCEFFDHSDAASLALDHVAEFVHHGHPRVEFFLASSRAWEALDWVPTSWKSRWPGTVWLGLIADTQDAFDENITEFLFAPTQRKFLVLAPLREAIDIDPMWCRRCMYRAVGLRAMGELGGDGTESGFWCMRCSLGNERRPLVKGWCLPHLAWVVIGADQGPDAVPFDETWVQNIVDACDEEGVPRYVAAIGTRALVRPGPEAWPVTDPAGADPREWPSAMWWRQWPVMASDRIACGPREPLPGIVSRDWAAREKTELHLAESGDGPDLVTRVFGGREASSRRAAKDAALVEHVGALLDTVVALHDDNRVWRDTVTVLQRELEDARCDADTIDRLGETVTGPAPLAPEPASEPEAQPGEREGAPGLYYYVVSTPFYVPVLATSLADAGHAAVTSPLFREAEVSVLRVVAEAPGFAIPPNAPVVVTEGFRAGCGLRRTEMSREIGEYAFADVGALLAQYTRNESQKA